MRREMDRLTAVLDPDVDQLQSLFESQVYNLSNPRSIIHTTP